MKRCPTCDKTFEDSMKFCQTDGTVLVAAAEQGGNTGNDADSTKTKIISTDELNQAAKDASPPSPFGSSAPSWMDSQDKPSDAFPPLSSPFDEPKSSGYSSPTSPFNENEPMFNEPQSSFNQSSYGNPSSASFGNQPEWTPPPAPISQWQNQNLGGNTPFQPSVMGQGEDKTLAIVSLVCGILSVTCCGAVTGIVALITGFMAKNKADANPQQFGGRGMALAGIIMGGISIVLTILYFVFVIIGGVLR